MSSGQYDVILADPPWRFENWGYDELGTSVRQTRLPDNHYATMTTEDICKLTIPAARDAVLLLWACWPKLPDAMRVIEAWGFEYKTLAWVWAKLNPSSMGFFVGMGYYTRANSEPCLLATRGNPRKPIARDVQALIVSPVREHSRKPDEQYGKIERLYPNGRYLEMFARRKHSERWDVWGNTIANDVEITPAPVTPTRGG